jgi:hypothetical protein
VFVFLLRIELLYNNGDTLRELPLVFTHLPPPLSVLASTESQPRPQAYQQILRVAKAAKAAVPVEAVLDEVTVNLIEREIGVLEEALQYSE